MKKIEVSEDGKKIVGVDFEGVVWERKTVNNVNEVGNQWVPIKDSDVKYTHAVPAENIIFGVGDTTKIEIAVNTGRYIYSVFKFPS